MAALRHSIGIDQPPFGGDSYPLVPPSGGIEQLLADLYLAYEDSNCALVTPFRIAWLYGFGENSSSPPAGYPSPEHSHDILIVDGNGTTVFDSTQADRYYEEAWGDHYLVLEWRYDRQILRVVKTTGSSYNRPASSFDDYLTPNVAIDSRALKRIQPQLAGIFVNEQLLENPELILEAGYNMRLDVERLPVVEGQKRVTRITLNAIPGEGDGRYPECAGDNRYLRTLMGQAPDSRGNLVLSGDECYRITVPYTTVDGEAVPVPHAIKIVNDCSPCADCDDYVRVYRAISNIHDSQSATYLQIAEARESHRHNIERWNEQKSCRESRNLRLVVVSQSPGAVSIGGAYANTSEKCLWDAELRFTGRVRNNGVPVQPQDRTPGFIAGSTHAGGTGLDGVVPYSLGGSWPTWFTRFDQIASGDSNFVRFGLSFNPQPGDVLEVTLTAHTPNAGSLGLPTVSVGPEVTNLWTSQPKGPAVAVQKRLVPLYPATADDSDDVPAHTHDVADIIGLDDLLAGKADDNHGHDIEDIDGLATSLDGKASSTHTHAADDISSGTLSDDRVAPSNVTQHEGAITHNNLSGLTTGDPHTQYALSDGTRWTANPVASRVAISDGSGNLVSSSVAVDDLEDLISGGGGVTDHGSLDGLGDDDHSQYALLAGRSGGQTIAGGTDAGDTLTLKGTDHATPGPVLIPNAIQLPVATITANTTLTAAHHTVMCDNSTDIDVTLPDASACAGRPYRVQKSGNNTSLVTIKDHLGNVVVVLYVLGDSAELASDGSNWHVVGGYLAPHSCLLVRSETQEGVAHSTATKILYDTAAADNAGLADIANSRAIIRRAGRYLLIGTAWIGAGGSNLILVDSYVYRNGSQMQSMRYQMRSTNNFDGAACVISIDDLASGDIIEGFCRHNGGSNKNILGNSTKLSITEVR